MLEFDRSATGRARRHLGWRKELLLASLPTAAVLAVFGLIERFTHQRLLFASLGASAFLIYLDPEHTTNSPRCSKEMESERRVREAEHATAS